MDLKEEIGQFMKENIPMSVDINSNEVNIRDSVHSTTTLFNYERTIVDTSFFQRLRFVSQMGAVNHVYPGAMHSRFSHSVGVVNTAGTILEHLQNRYPMLIDESTIRNVRLSALLHDIGHGPFSHLSETIMSKFGDMKNEQNRDLFIGSVPHEIIAWHMVNSDAMHDFLNSLALKCYVTFDIDEIANYIIGQTRNPSSTRFIAEIINGAFDADKLDYMQRDAYSIGIKSPFESELLIRHLRIVIIDSDDKKHRRIGISEEGIENILDLAYHKLKVARIIYDPNVRAAERMIFEIFDYAIETAIPINNIIIKSSVDMLRISENDILGIRNTGNERIDKIIKGLSTHKLYEPSLIISHKSIVEDKHGSLDGFLEMSESKEKIDKIRTLIADEIGGECSKYDILVDIPPSISMRFLSHINILEKDKTVIPLNHLFPYTNWLESYLNSVWKAYVFSSPEYLDKVTKASKKVLKNLFGLEFNKYSTPCGQNQTRTIP